MNETAAERHLTDEELFALAAPAAGEPEALPRHLADCAACGRALQDWKESLRELGEEELGPIGRRSDDDWRAAEDATLSAIRRTGARPSPKRALRWAIGIAASLLLVALAMPWRAAAPARMSRNSAVSPAGATVGRPSDDGLSAADRDDDELLRDAAYLARGGGDHDDVSLEESL